MLFNIICIKNYLSEPKLWVSKSGAAFYLGDSRYKKEKLCNTKGHKSFIILNRITMEDYLEYF